MDKTDRMNFEDPLFARLNHGKKGSAGKAEEPAPSRPDKTGNRAGKILLGLLLMAGTGAGIGYLANQLQEAHQKITQLSENLTQSQARLEDVTQKLQQSEQVIGELRSGLSESRNKITRQDQELRRYQGVFQELKNEQQQQVRELEALALQKADQSQVESLRGEAGEIKKQVTTLHSNLADLRELSTRNRGDLDATRTELEGVRLAVEGNTSQLTALRNSLERDYYTFELREKGGIMKVFNVALSLKDIDFKKQRYDLEILVEGKRMQKKDQYINEPIFFHVEGSGKPYELVVTKVSEKFVTGYLSVPRQVQP